MGNGLLPASQEGSSCTSSKPRPPLLRALGRSEPPIEVEVDGSRFVRQEILKHDTWAATAVYVQDQRSIVCKFNRRQPIAGISMRWLGNALARREAAALARLADVRNVPRLYREVYADGRRCWNAVAHEYIPGHAFREKEKVDDQFFPRLHALIRTLHARQMAYVDLHKRENIIVGEDGQPYLVDFQISFCLPRFWPANSWPARLLLSILQQSDEYHFQKHFSRCRPKQFGKAGDVGANPPFWIAMHRWIGTPFRRWRRWLLTRIGIRQGEGNVESEHFVEIGRRPPPAAATLRADPAKVTS